MVKANKTTSKNAANITWTIYKTLYFRSREALHHLNIRICDGRIAFAMAGVIPAKAKRYD